MRALTCLLSLLILSASSARAEPKNIAELFPANSLVYVEFCQPGATAKQIASFLKGSALENALPVLNKLREKPRATETIDTTEAGLLSTLLGPEMLKEAGRFKGIAAALTGFKKTGEPEFVAIVLTGESQLPGFLMRAFLSANSDLRKVASIDGLDLHQENQAQLVDIDGAIAPQGMVVENQEKLTGPVYAYESGIIVSGSDKEIVSATIRRWKGKAPAESLAGQKSFMAVAVERAKPGLFLYSNAKLFLEKLYALNERTSDVDPSAWVILKKLLPPSAVETLTARLTLSDQGIELRSALRLNSKTPGLLGELLTGPSLTAADLGCMVKGGEWSLFMNLPEGEQRLARLLAVIDVVIKATGSLGPTASEFVRELDEKKILSSKMLGKIKRITLSMPPMASGAKGDHPLPALLVHTDDVEALSALRTAIPEILTLLGGQKADAVVETIGTVKVHSLEAKASPTGVVFHFGCTDKALAIGTDRNSIAAMLTPNASKLIKGPDGQAISQNSVKDATVIGLWNWAQMLQSPDADKSKEISSPPTGGPFSPPSITGRLHAIQQQEFRRILSGLPLLVMSLGRVENELRLEVRQNDPNGLRAKAIDGWFEWFTRNSSGSIFRNGYYEGRVIDNLGQPPPPPLFLPPLGLPGPP